MFLSERDFIVNKIISNRDQFRKSAIENHALCNTASLQFWDILCTDKPTSILSALNWPTRENFSECRAQVPSVYSHMIAPNRCKSRRRVGS